MKNLIVPSAFLVIAAIFFTSCDKDNEPKNEDELITTVMLIFSDPIDSTSQAFFASDTDGEGGNPPIVDEIILSAGNTYQLEVRFMDLSNPNNLRPDLTDEIEEESADHLVCFEATGAMAVPTIGDLDGNGKPLGLKSALANGTAGTGTLQVTLKHLPDKSISAPCSTGDTDVDVTFDVTIQ